MYWQWARETLPSQALNILPYILVSDFWWTSRFRHMGSLETTGAAQVMPCAGYWHLLLLHLGSLLLSQASPYPVLHAGAEARGQAHVSDALGIHPHNTARVQNAESIQDISCFRGWEHLSHASSTALASRLPLTRAVEPISQILSGFSASQSSSLGCSSGTPLPLRPRWWWHCHCRSWTRCSLCCHGSQDIYLHIQETQKDQAAILRWSWRHQPYLEQKGFALVAHWIVQLPCGHRGLGVFSGNLFLN